MVLRKDEIEASLQAEQELIRDGKLKEDNPLDLSENFDMLCEACRRGDLKVCQEMITAGANINARDRFDYTPLILVSFASLHQTFLSVSSLHFFFIFFWGILLMRQGKASLCGHYEVLQLLLEAGALCERDTFQGERCLYNALTDRIRKLLLESDYSKSTDPLQPFAAHISSLLTREYPPTSDILVTAGEESFRLHKFVVSARSPYFFRKLAVAPDTAVWKLPPTIPPQSFGIAIRYIYFGEVPNDVGGGPGTGFTEDEILDGIDKISKQLEIRSLWNGILESGDRRLARQRRTDEIEKGRDQVEAWFRSNVLKQKIVIDAAKAGDVKWDRNNGVFADVLLRADESEDSVQAQTNAHQENEESTQDVLDGIPIEPLGQRSRSPHRIPNPRKSVIFPVHRAMLLRAEYFLTMFLSGFREAQDTEYLQIIRVDCSPDVLETVLQFIYTEKADMPLELAIDVLFAADLLLIEKLKMKAAVVISTLGSGSMSQIPGRLDVSDPKPVEQEELDIYDVVRAGWLTRVPRLEEFGARYIANRLEYYIDEDEFADLVRESAGRIKGRQETDTIELLDDIRYYLSERFRLRFEDSGIEEMMEEDADAEADKMASLGDEQAPVDKGIDVGMLTKDTQMADIDHQAAAETQVANGAIRTLDGKLVGDELEVDAMNYRILLAKIDRLLETLKLDA